MWSRWPGCGRSSTACAANREVFLERAYKEALHETGHLFGLVHCAERKCAMSLATTVRQIDVKHDAFCAAVRGALAAPSRGNTSMKSHWQILVVDDEEVMCESLAAWLREDGYAVDTAASGREARGEGAADATTPSTSST